MPSETTRRWCRIPGSRTNFHAREADNRLCCGDCEWYPDCVDTLNGGVIMPGIASIHEFLHEAHVPYSIVPHRPAFTARTEALATHVPARDWAKVVICFVDEEPVEAVIPATSKVNLVDLLELAGGGSIRIADEEELRMLFPECELGAMPPFGPLYGQPVYVDAALAREPKIVFNAGTHEDAIAMRWNDFVRTVDPIVGTFAE
jgi:Ala-tRNA(Pro) deacylase